VGALGIPALFGGVETSCQFLSTSLHQDVLNAYHAISVDERREQFPATLWQPSSPPVPGQVLEQVYFAGVHCDIGGGYPETDLSDITFGWMASKAMALGTLFNQAALADFLSINAENALGMKHESWNVVWGFPRSRAIDTAWALGNSVPIRYQSDSSYRPPNLSGNESALAPGYRTETVVGPPPSAPAMIQATSASTTV
jgi:hypothetical protein